MQDHRLYRVEWKNKFGWNSMLTVHDISSLQELQEIFSDCYGPPVNFSNKIKKFMPVDFTAEDFLIADCQKRYNCWTPFKTEEAYSLGTTFRVMAYFAPQKKLEPRTIYSDFEISLDDFLKSYFYKGQSPL